MMLYNNALSASTVIAAIAALLNFVPTTTAQHASSLLPVTTTSTAGNRFKDGSPESYRSLALRLSKEVSENFSMKKNAATEDKNEGGRSLQSFASAFRDQICDPFIQGFKSEAPNSSCSCSTSTYTINCSIKSICLDVPECEGGLLCASAHVEVDFRRSGNNAIISSVELAYFYTSGAAYDGYRLQVNENDGCALYFTFEGLEYKCNGCTVCTNDGVTLDCSNIMPSWVTGVCVTESETASDVNADFPVCPVGGAMTPTSIGRTPPNSSAPMATMVIGGGRAFMLLLVFAFFVMM